MGKKLKTEQPKEGNAYGVVYVTGAMGNLCDSCIRQKDCYYARKPADAQYVIKCGKYRRRVSYL